MEFQWDDKLVAEFHAKVNGVATFKEDDVQRAMKVMDAFKKAHPFGFKTEDGYCVVDTFHVNDYLFAVDVGTLKVSRVPVMNGEIVGFADVIGKKKFFRYVENMQSYVDLLVSEEVGKLKFDIPKAFKGIIDEEELNKNPHLQFWKKVFDLKECPHQKQKIGFDFDVAQPKNILSFRVGGKVSVYQNGFNYNEWVLGHLKDKHEIFSIQNSLGEILTVGNLTGWGIIERFDILTEGRVFASVKYNKRTKKLVVYCSERNFVWTDPKEVSSIADVEKKEVKFEDKKPTTFQNALGWRLTVGDDVFGKSSELHLGKITDFVHTLRGLMITTDRQYFIDANEVYKKEPEKAEHPFGKLFCASNKRNIPEGILSMGKDGMYLIVSFNDGQYQKQVSTMLTNGFKIWSVKNKHGEVLTVGDQTSFGKVEKFTILNKVRQGYVGMPESVGEYVIVVDLEEGKHIWRSIDEVRPVKKEKKYPEGIKRFYGDGSETVDRDFTGKELEYQHWVADNLNQKAKIVCVKNKHGEVLKVGDETNLGCILSFEIRDGIIKMNNEKRFDDLYVIDEVHPLSKGIFTEDGFVVNENKLQYSRHNIQYALLESDSIRIVKDAGKDDSEWYVKVSSFFEKLGR